MLSILALMTGCSNRNAYLEVLSSEPIRKEHGIRVYAVHVGSTESLRFTVNFGDADYAVAHNLTTDEYVDCGEPYSNKFEWLQEFDRVTPHDAPEKITVTAYLKFRNRDAMPIGGRLERRKSKFDDDDIEWAVGTIAIEVYQGLAEFAVNLGDRTPNWTLSRVVFYGDDGLKSEHRQADDGMEGFRVEGPEEDGTWRVSCEPSDNEVCREGSTKAELIVADDHGHTRRIETQIRIR